jgi:hypothetical protein
MKNLIVVLLSLIIVNSYAQKSAPTTQDEYTYLTKGLKSQIDAGIGVKPGYKLVDLGKHADGGKSLNISGLIRDNETKPCALLLVYKNGKDQTYLCVPSADAAEGLWGAYKDSLKVFGENLSWANYYLGKFMMGYITQ